jgi:hypothetical protein
MTLIRSVALNLVEPPAAAYLLAVPRTAGGFLSLLVQRKKPKKARPGAAEYSLRFSPESALA